MDWLNHYASAIQALSSIVSLVVACVLAVLTAKYVKLTKDIAGASSDQLAFVREAASATRRQAALSLAAAARRLKATLASLDQSVPTHAELMAFAQLQAQDISDLQTLAQAVSPSAVTLASKAAVSLRVLLGTITAAKAVNLGTGWYPSPAQTSEWESSMQAGISMLKSLEAAGTEAAAT